MNTQFPKRNIAVIPTGCASGPPDLRAACRTPYSRQPIEQPYGPFTPPKTPDPDERVPNLSARDLTEGGDLAANRAWIPQDLTRCESRVLAS